MNSEEKKKKKKGKPQVHVSELERSAISAQAGPHSRTLLLVTPSVSGAASPSCLSAGELLGRCHRGSYAKCQGTLSQEEAYTYTLVCFQRQKTNVSFRCK